MFGPNALWHSLAGGVSEESGKGREQQEWKRQGRRGSVEVWENTHLVLAHLICLQQKIFSQLQ